MFRHLFNHRHLLATLLVTTALLMTSGARAGESTFEASETGGKTVCWKAITAADGSTSYSVKDRATGEYRPATDPVEISDLRQRTEKFYGQIDALRDLGNGAGDDLMKRSTQLMLDPKYLPARHVPGPFQTAVQTARVVLAIVSLLLMVFAGIARLTRGGRTNR